jgi:excisionase family DNA binding protein
MDASHLGSICSDERREPAFFSHFESGIATMEKLLTVRETAAILRLQPWAVYQKAKRGEIPIVRLGRTIRISPEALQDRLSQKSAAVPPASPRDKTARLR